MKKVLFAALVFLCTYLFPQAPTATITAASTSVCTGKGISFSSVTTNTPTAYTWTTNPTPGVFYVFGHSQPTVALSFQNAGIYTVSLTVSNASGTVTTSQTITALQTPSASFSASLTTVGFPNQINLTNFSTNATSYLWTYSETGATDNTANAIHSYTAGGSYSLSLIALNSNGCSDTSRYSFYISDSSGVTLPNIFTPNGDGVNDIFKPIMGGISSLKVDIYTRWGNYVYGWTTRDGFWDGYTVSGEPCVSGVYFYVIEATGFDGKTYKSKSNLTLLRNQ
jgi:gliding motility-associated-like protein